MRKKPDADPDAYSSERAVAVQLSRLFGSASKEATAKNRTPAQWRRTLKGVLGELERYVLANVDTDELHRWMLFMALLSAGEALKHDDFWPGYTEGITRFALILLGDYPDHRKRKPGRKTEGHYLLNSDRSVHYTQTPQQRFRALCSAGNIGYPRLSAPPLDILNEFRRSFGFKPSQADFMEWYRKNFPKDYAAIFR